MSSNNEMFSFSMSRKTPVMHYVVRENFLYRSSFDIDFAVILISIM